MAPLKINCYNCYCYRHGFIIYLRNTITARCKFGKLSSLKKIAFPEGLKSLTWGSFWALEEGYEPDFGGGFSIWGRNSGDGNYQKAEGFGRKNGGSDNRICSKSPLPGHIKKIVMTANGFIEKE